MDAKVSRYRSLRRRPGADGLAPLPLVTGVLKGYDQLLNLVLDEVQENLQGGECFRT